MAKLKLSTDELKKLTYAGLIKYRYVHLRSMSAASKRPADTMLGERADEATLDDIAHLLAVKTGRPDDEFKELYNKLVGRLVGEKTPYRYRYIDFDLLDKHLKDWEIMAWVHLKEFTISTGYLETHMLEFIRDRITEPDFKELKDFMLYEVESRMAKFLLNRKEWMSEDDIKMTMKLSKDAYHVQDMVTKEMILGMTSLKNRLSVTQSMISGSWRAGGRTTGNLTRQELDEILRSLTLIYPNEVSQMVNELNRRAQQK